MAMAMAQAVAVASSIAALPRPCARTSLSPCGQSLRLRASQGTRQLVLKSSYRGVRQFSASSKRQLWRVCCETDTSSDSRQLSQISDESALVSSDGSETSETSTANPLSPQVQLDLNLPRRSLLVEFTCNVCNTRTQRLINPKAHKSGTVFVQCAGCEAYHQLVDNLNLVQEYDFRNEVVSESADEDSG